MPPTVRRARPDDADGLHALAAATFPLACPPGTAEEDSAAFVAEHLSARRFREYVEDATREVFVADEEGRPVGFTLLVLAEPADADVAAALHRRPTAELSKCYVDPTAQGTGVAAALVAATVEAAADRGCAGVWLGVNQQNARANRFYEKVGFERVGVKRFRVGSREFDDFVRERAIPSEQRDPAASTLGSP